MTTSTATRVVDLVDCGALGRIFIVKEENLKLVAQPGTHYYVTRFVFGPEGLERLKRLDEAGDPRNYTQIHRTVVQGEGPLPCRHGRSYRDHQSAKAAAIELRRRLHPDLTDTQVAFKELGGTL
jgi:hypothetical protein